MAWRCVRVVVRVRLIAPLRGARRISWRRAFSVCFVSPWPSPRQTGGPFHLILQSAGSHAVQNRFGAVKRRSNMRSMTVLLRLTFGVAALAVVTAGCASENAALTTPTPVAPPSVVETFTGSLIAFGSNMHTFTVSQLGEVHVTLRSTTLEPTIDPDTGDPIPPADPTAVPELTL